MAISISRRRSRAIPAASIEPEAAVLPAEPLAIGLPDVDVTSCPVCARPITVGQGRCPGCGTRLLLGVPMKRAGVFVALGVAVGLVVGGTAASLVLGATRPVTVPSPSAGAPAVPAGGPAGSAAAASSASPGAPTQAPVASAAVPAQASAALAQVIVVDARLAARAAELRTELGAKPFDSFAVATTLRGLAADAVVGSGVTGLVGTWPTASPLSASLRAYYARVSTSATSTLAASLTDIAAYRAGAGAMLRVLADLAPLDAEAQLLATQAGLPGGQ